MSEHLYPSQNMPCGDQSILKVEVGLLALGMVVDPKSITANRVIPSGPGSIALHNLDAFMILMLYYQEPCWTYSNNNNGYNGNGGGGGTDLNYKKVLKSTTTTSRVATTSLVSTRAKYAIDH